MSRHAHRSCRLPAAFQARSAPGSSASQKPAAPFPPVCRSRECRHSSKYHQGQHLRRFPRCPRLSHRKAADCGCHGQLSDILPQGQDRSCTSLQIHRLHLWCYGTAIPLNVSFCNWLGRIPTIFLLPCENVA